MALRLTFPKQLVYDPKEGIRNSILSLLFKALYDLSGHKKVLVHPTGFEPMAPRLGIWCSIRLSYGCTQQSLLSDGWLVNALRGGWGRIKPLPASAEAVRREILGAVRNGNQLIQRMGVRFVALPFRAIFLPFRS